jgi:DNA modification methylase
MLELNKIYNMDCLEGLKKLDDNSIDLVVTSPPYDDLRVYKGYSFDFENIAKGLFRVLKKGGVIVWVIGDATKNGSETGTSFRQALFFMDLGLNLHDTMIYAKVNYLPLTHNRYEQQFEYMFIFSKGKPKTFNPFKIKCANIGAVRSYSYNCASTKEKSAIRSGRKEKRIIKEFRIKPNIWFYKVGKNHTTKDDFAFGHPALFPEKLAKDHILSWSNEGNLVLDPFAGGGTTLKMAKQTNRKFIGFEISEEYIRICLKRFQQKTLFDIM